MINTNLNKIHINESFSTEAEKTESPKEALKTEFPKRKY